MDWTNGINTAFMILWVMVALGIGGLFLYRIWKEISQKPTATTTEETRKKQ